MIEILVLAALIIHNTPACDTCGLAFLSKPFAHFGTSDTDPNTGALVVTTHESAWTIRDVLVVGLLLAALVSTVFRKERIRVS